MARECIKHLSSLHFEEPFILRMSENQRTELLERMVTPKKNHFGMIKDLGKHGISVNKFLHSYFCICILSHYEIILSLLIKGC